METEEIVNKYIVLQTSLFVIAEMAVCVVRNSV